MKRSVFDRRVAFTHLLLLLAGLNPMDGALAQIASVAPEPSPLDAVVITARKRSESVAEVPASITVFPEQALAAFDIRSFDDYASKTANLSFAYGQGTTAISAARSIAIRGITGQNLFGTAGATGFYIDDTPVPESIDPRILDVADIEVLKGPQGTLYGESSLGGNVRIVTKHPSFEGDTLGYSAQAGLTSGGGSADGGVGVVDNLVLSPDRLAVRIVLFGDHDAGYLRRTYPDPTSPAASDPFVSAPRTSVGDQGASMSWGGSVTASLRPTEPIEARLRVMFQTTNDHGFPAAFAPLPAFTPQYTLDRAFDFQPRASDEWALPSLDLTYHAEGFTVVSATSFLYRHTEDIEDSNYGTQQVLRGYYGVPDLPSQSFFWDQKHYHRQWSEELRVTFDASPRLSGTVGAYYSQTRARLSIPPTYATGLVAATAGNTVVGPWPNDLLWTDDNPQTQADTSLFGELYGKLAQRWTVTLGAREYWLKQTTDFTADGFFNFGPTPSAPESDRQSGLSPKFGLSYQASDAAMLYASASKGFRAGGAQPYLPFCALPSLPISDITQLKSDTLWAYEIGAKLRVPRTEVLISAAAFHIDWSNLQQQVALPCGAYFDINGNAAHVDGVEFEAAGAVTPGLQVRLSAGYERTDVTDPGPLAIVGVAAGSRILGTPAWNASLGGVYTHALGPALEGFVSADWSYTAGSLSLVNGGGGLFATRPGYALANLRLGVRSGATEWALSVRNLGNAKPNLGDVGYVGYAQYTSGGTIVPQVATLPPLTVLAQYRRNL